ncbi:MAG: cation transporter [Reichenbachiella sp.]|uniref:heavy-metal-associated domain-containing protein n=1 Tax=Reichenbachiella sp. TaxID=2184521 RepID=UPI003262E25E
MKALKNILYIIVMLIAPLTVQAQKKEKPIVTCEFAVRGVCEMCKARIEEAALIRGVKMAEWDNTTGILTAVYRKDKISEREIHEAIAAVGHTTDQVAADSTAYSKLPQCCAYDDGVNKH